MVWTNKNGLDYTLYILLLYYKNKTIYKKKRIKNKVKQEDGNIYYEPLTTIAKGKFIIEL